MHLYKITYIGWEKKWQPNPVFLYIGKFHEQETGRPSPWGCKQSATTERLYTHIPRYMYKSKILFLYTVLSNLS